MNLQVVQKLLDISITKYKSEKISSLLRRFFVYLAREYPLKKWDTAKPRWFVWCVVDLSRWSKWQKYIWHSVIQRNCVNITLKKAMALMCHFEEAKRLRNLWMWKNPPSLRFFPLLAEGALCGVDFSLCSKWLLFYILLRSVAISRGGINSKWQNN